MNLMKCLKCFKEIVRELYKSDKYCSKHCQDLYLKSEYRKKHRDIVNGYNRKWRATRKNKELVEYTDGCYFCGDGLTIDHHVSYLPEVRIKICRKCHQKLHKVLNLMKVDRR